MYLDDMNQSELVLLAQDHEPNVHRGLDRQVLCDIILGKEVELPRRRIDKLRVKIMAYILEHWKQVKPLLTCPAITESPTACFTCTDMQVIECAMTNPQIFKIKTNASEGEE